MQARPAGQQAKTRPGDCPSHTRRHPGAHAGFSRPCGEHRMHADCRAHAPTLATAPSPALQPIGHPYRDLRPGQVHQLASGPACHADRGARLHGAIPAGPAAPQPACTAGTHPACRIVQIADVTGSKMRSQRRSPTTSRFRAAAIASAAATLSGFSRTRRNIPVAYGAYRDAVAGRERSADAASLRHVLARRRSPSSAQAGIPGPRRPDLLRPRRPAVARPPGCPPRALPRSRTYNCASPGCPTTSRKSPNWT